MVSYDVGAVVTVTVMHVLLFVLHVSIAARMEECEGDGNAGMVSGGGVVAVSACMGGTRGSCVLSNTGDVQEMSVVKGVGGVCDKCMCLARGGVGGVGCERIGFWLCCRNMEKVGYVSVFWLR